MVKDSLLHVPVFLLVFVAVFAAVLFLSVLAAWTGMYNPAFPADPGWLKQELTYNAGEALLASVFISLFFLFFRIKKRQGNSLLSFLLPLAASFLILLTGVTVVYGPPGSPVPQEYSAFVPLVPTTILETGDDLMYVDEVSVLPGDSGIARVRNLVTYAKSELTYYREASVAAESTGGQESTVIVPDGVNQTPISITPANPLYEPLFKPPAALSSLSADIRLLNIQLLEKRAKSPEGFTLALFSVLLLAVSCMFFARFSRWPLFNALLTLAIFRGIFFIPRFLESDIGRDLHGMISNQSVDDTLLTLVFLALGVLFTAMNFVFPGKRRG